LMRGCAATEVQSSIWLSSQMPPHPVAVQRAALASTRAALAMC
jgi:hypothetical protein